MNDKRAELESILEWAKNKTHSGVEPPWAWHQYNNLIIDIEGVLKALDACVTTESLQQSESHSGNALRLVVSRSKRDNSLPHSIDEQVPLPM
jgi:hypothetical protein